MGLNLNCHDCLLNTSPTPPKYFLFILLLPLLFLPRVSLHCDLFIALWNKVMATTDTITIVTWIETIMKNDEGCHNTTCQTRERMCERQLYIGAGCGP
jgi:hypothetical protein